MLAIDLLGNEVQELYKNDAIKQLSLKLKSKQGKSDLTVSNDLKGSCKKGDQTWSSKAVLKTEGHVAGSEVELTVNTKECGVKYAWEPEQLNHDKTSGSIEVELKHGNDSSLEASATLMAGGYDVAGAVPYSTLGINIKKDAPSGGPKCPFGYTLTWSEAFRFQDFHLGFESVFDDIKEGRKWAYIKSTYAFLAYTGAQNAFFRTACLDKIVSVGTWGKHEKIAYAAEVTANLNKDYKKGLSETMPINIRLASTMPLSHGMKLHNILNVGAAVTLKKTIDIPMRDHLKMKVQAECDLKKVIQEPATALSGLGVTWEYKL
jgi:hypothetical protein